MLTGSKRRVIAPRLDLHVMKPFDTHTEERDAAQGPAHYLDMLLREPEMQVMRASARHMS